MNEIVEEQMTKIMMKHLAGYIKMVLIKHLQGQRSVHELASINSKTLTQSSTTLPCIVSKHTYYSMYTTTISTFAYLSEASPPPPT
jgi:hypothetical protein